LRVDAALLAVEQALLGDARGGGLVTTASLRATSM
jgi:hypothetical protein